MNSFGTKTKLAPRMAMDRNIRRTVGLFKFLDLSESASNSLKAAKQSK